MLSMPDPFRLLSQTFVLLALLLGTLGCDDDTSEATYVARVGDYTLTEAEVDGAMMGGTQGLDTTEARRQIIEQWVTRTLLLREAVRLNLEQRTDVQTQLEEQRTTVLVNALTSDLYEEATVPPSDDEVRSYFDRNRQQFALREPYVRVRHLQTDTREAAETVRAALVEVEPDTGAVADSVWTSLVARYAQASQQALSRSRQFFPEGRLFGALPYVRDELAELDAGDVSPVTEDGDAFHVVALIRRIPEGTEPELAWVEDEIRRRLTIRARKQMYMREVQRLRNEAQARNELDVR